MAAEVFEGVCTDLPPAKRNEAHRAFAAAMRTFRRGRESADGRAASQRDALEYHRLPTHGKISVTPDQEPCQPARSRARLFAWRRLCVPGHQGRPERGRDADVARQPRRRDHQRHRGARARQHRPACRQAGDGRQGAACSRSSPASTSSTSRSTRRDPDKLVDIVASLEPTFGGINLEDIKAPDASIIERALRERMKIPVFHDDQHGTAIIVARGGPQRAEAGRQGYRRGQARRAPARAPRRIACLDLLVSLGLRAREHPRRRHQGRRLRGPHARRWTRSRRATRRHTAARTLAEIIARRRRLPRPFGRRRAQAGDGQAHGARSPLILALANPDAGNPAGSGEGGAPRRHHRHRPFRLPEPGQQRPVLSVHLPRRARRRRHRPSTRR